MSTDTYAATVSNVARVGKCSKLEVHALDNEHKIVPGWEFAEGGNFPQEPEDGEDSLYVDVFKSGDRVVYVVNSHQYASVGEFDWVVFGPNATHVQEFLDVLEVKTKIRKSGVVKQTL